MDLKIKKLVRGIPFDIPNKNHLHVTFFATPTAFPRHFVRQKCPELTLCGWQDDKIQELNFLDQTAFPD